MSINPNAFYRSDCRSLLERVSTETVTLAYLDPPWFTMANYNVVFENEWVRHSHKDNVRDYSEYSTFLEHTLQQIYRVLTLNGSLYLHVDPKHPSDARLMLDQLFGKENFQLEITLPQRRHHLPGRQHETILVYTKSPEHIYYTAKRKLTKNEIRRRYPLRDEKGVYHHQVLTGPGHRPTLVYSWKGFLPPKGQSWRYTEERMKRLDNEGLIHYSLSGRPLLKRYYADLEQIEVGSIWDDIQPLAIGRESLGIPTQRSLDLVRRIVGMATSEGDIVIDPFCGAGTTLIASEQMGRRWIGCEVDTEVYELAVGRLEQERGLQPNLDYNIGDQKLLENLPLATASWKPVPLVRSIDEIQDSKRPVVYVEGKTDVSILTTAWRKLYGRQSMHFVIKDSNPHAEDDTISAGGTDSLQKFISNVRADHLHTAIGIFDNDYEGIKQYNGLPSRRFQEVAELEAKVAKHKRSAAFLLPVPPGKELYAQYQNLCIEFYFGDEALSQKTANGRGLKLDFPDEEVTIKRHNRPLIRVTKSSILEAREIKGGKTVFAQEVVPNLADEEFEAFRTLFTKIEKVIAYLKG